MRVFPNHLCIIAVSERCPGLHSGTLDSAAPSASRQGRS
jgi:hypothetical protein